MKAWELKRDFGYYSPESDEYNARKLTDTRKKPLTLRALNRLKKIKMTREMELLQRANFLELMYAAPEEAAGGGGGGFGL